MAFFERDHFRMHYEVHPGLVAHDTLFIHGNFASNVWWEPALRIWQERKNKSQASVQSQSRSQAEAQYETQYKAQYEAQYKGSLIMAEWRGCGQSSAPQDESELHMENLADDYLALLEHLGVARARVVGHSAGGLIALLCLHRSLEPNRLERAVLLDPVSLQGVHFAPENQAAFLKMQEDRGFCALVMAATIKGVNPNDPFFQKILEDAFRIPRVVRTGIPKALQLGTIDYRDCARSIPQPVLVLHGSEDPVLPIQGSRDLAALLPQGEFRELTHAGHSYNVEDPAGFTRLLDDFLRL